MNQDPKQIALRYRAIFGPGWQGKLARCIGCGDNVVSFQVRGHANVQHWFASYIEFFEVTPRALWPERWALLREAANIVGPESPKPSPWVTVETARRMAGLAPADFQIIGPVEINPYKEFVKGLILRSDSPLAAKTDGGASDD